MKKQKKQAFTLVELIVVITILAILGTIAFISMQGYSATARDSVRISDLKNIETGLELYKIKAGNVPIPDEKVDISASGTIIAYQGFVGKRILNLIGVSNDGIDPIDETFYTYMTDIKLKKYQIMVFLENSNEITYNITNGVNASLEKRYPYVKGSDLGIIIDSNTNEPIQKTGSGIDILNSNVEYKAYINNNIDGIITGTGGSLARIGTNFEIFGTCKKILEKYGTGISDGIYKITIEGDENNESFEVYCDMTTDGGGWTLVWKSLNNYNIDNNDVNISGLKNTNIDGFSKLSDSKINKIKSSTNTDTVGYRVEQSENICTPKSIGYISASCTFNRSTGGVTRGSGCDKGRIDYLNGDWFIDSYYNWCLDGWTSTIFCSHNGTNAVVLHLTPLHYNSCYHSYYETMVWVK